MDNETKDTIRKLQANLLRIKNGEKFFYNLTQYKNLDLIYTRDKWHVNAYGQKVRIGCNVYLTDKGKRILNTVI